MTHPNTEQLTYTEWEETRTQPNRHSKLFSLSAEAIPENREFQKWKLSFFRQRHTLSTSFDIFVITYRVTNFLPKLVTCYYFLPKKLNFHFWFSPIFGLCQVLMSGVYKECFTSLLCGVSLQWDDVGSRLLKTVLSLWNSGTGDQLLESVPFKRRIVSVYSRVRIGSNFSALAHKGSSQNWKSSEIFCSLFLNLSHPIKIVLIAKQQLLWEKIRKSISWWTEMLQSASMLFYSL